MGAPRASIRHFDQLPCWQHAYAFASECYRVARLLPRYEQAGLGAQWRRAAASVPANIAEGFGRGSQRDFARFLYVARCSLLEAESHLRLAENAGLIVHDSLVAAFDLGANCGRSLNGLIR